jgi:hypothetical protein
VSNFFHENKKRMLENSLKNPYFNYIFSFVIGMALVFIVRPVCNGKECGEVFKAPPVEEIKDAVFRIGAKCYEFKTKVVDCPTAGVIESFRDGDFAMRVAYK